MIDGLFSQLKSRLKQMVHRSDYSHGHSLLHLQSRQSPRQQVNLKLELLEPRLVLDSTVVFNELMYNPIGTDETLEWIELHNQMAVDMDLSAWQLTDGVEFTFPQGTILGGGEYLIIAKSPTDFEIATGITTSLGPFVGSLSNGGEQIDLINNSNRVMDSLSYGDSGRWPVGPDGSGSTLAKQNKNAASDLAANWTTSTQTGGTPGAVNFIDDGPLLGPSTTLITEFANWSYEDSDTDLGTAWRESAFDDSTWSTGNALLGFEEATLENPITTPLNPGATTYYFRHEFVFSGTPGATQLTIDTIFDDGAVYYLNGQEVLRLNMPSGVIDHQTLATSAVRNAIVQDQISLPTDNLIVGTNVLAVEVHQAEQTVILPAPPPAPTANGAALIPSGGGLTLISEGPAAPAAGGAAPINLATGAIAFALDELSAFGHFTNEVNDGFYGNAFSWIGNGFTGTEGAFIGIDLGSTPILGIESIAFGRSNVLSGDPCGGGVCTDRTLGFYTLQYTQVADPSTNLALLTTGDDSTGWVTIGTLDYQSAGGANFAQPHLRHQYTFDPVDATAIRLIVPASGLGGGTAIDEIELYNNTAFALEIASEAGFSISWDGNDGDHFDAAVPAVVPVNLVTERFGLTTFGSGELEPGGAHAILNVADGIYGDSNSWRPDIETPAFIGLNFNSPLTFDRIAFGRDNGNSSETTNCPAAGQCTDGAIGTYTIQMTNVSDPSAATLDSDWQSIGTITYNFENGSFTPHLRHEYLIQNGGSAITATGLRILVSDVGMTIDEIELYLTPEPQPVEISPAAGFDITWDGNDGDFFDPANPAVVPDNLALASNGATAFTSGDLQPAGPIHFAARLNDGIYGNSNSWISAGAPAFAGLNFGGQIDIQRIAWGRDNGNNVTDACSGQCTDRSLGTYTIQITRLANPNASTSDTGNAATGWQTIGTLDYDFTDASFTPYLRHEYAISEAGDAISATGIRIEVSDPGTAIDEIEIYGIEFFDVVFGAELSSAELLPDPAQLVISEVAAGGDAAFFVEIANTGQQTVDLENYQLVRDGVTLDQFTFPATQILAGQYLSIDAAALGFTGSDSDKLFLYNPGQTGLIDAVVVDDVLRGRSTENEGRWLYPDSATPNLVNSFSFADDIVINEIMFHARPDAGSADTLATFQTTTLLPINAAWNYNQAGVDLGSNWYQSLHPVDNVDWFSGPALLGFETNPLGLPASIGTPLVDPSSNNPFVTTYYFETDFQFNGVLADIDLLEFRHVVDDGAIFYLNGQELSPRFNMPEGTVTGTTFSNGVVTDGQFSSFISIPKNLLQQGNNHLAVEVHQRTNTSSDIIFGLEVQVSEELTPFIPGQPFAESTEEWIELYNRGITTVDLTGWTIRDGISFDFPAATEIAAGEYLVISNDAATLSATYPSITVLGDFSGKLSNSSERILLRDANKNPADEVTYFDGGRWAGYADGGGSTLELRDADADNSLPEAWAASDESGKSSWQTYTYSGVATADTTPIRWNEFVVGLFGAGEVLLDDLSVIKEPNGAAVSLLQNGDFESDAINSSASAWRVLGNHRQTQVIDDPDNLGTNKVLRLVSTGQTSDRQNHLETTFIGNQIAPNGLEYEISFRAKWLAGERGFNTRLYFNRLAARTILDVPQNSGTPGAANSIVETNIGPTYEGFKHGPVVPSAGQAVEVSVVAADPDGVASMSLFYSVDGAAFFNVAMTDMGGGLYSGNIPGQGSSDIVQFYVEGMDTLGAISTFPADGANSRALYKVQDSLASSTGLHNFRIIMTADDTNDMHNNANVMGNDTRGATVIYNESEVFYDVGVRLKGSMAARPNPAFVGFSVQFNPSQKFRGVHEQVAIDRSGRGALVANGQEEILIKQMMNAAGGIQHSMFDDLIHVIAPRSSETGSAALLMAEHGDVFLESQFDNGDDGKLFNFDLIYYQRATVGDPVEGLKTPVGYGHPGNNIDLENRGANKENYRWHFRQKNNRRDDDYSDLIPFLQAMSLTGSSNGSALDIATSQLMDVDQWMRMFAMQSLGGVAGDVYGRGLNHNLRLYIPPDGGKVLAFPWDMDLSSFNPNVGGLYPNANVRKVIDIPNNKHYFDGHLQDLMTTTFNSTYLQPFVDNFSNLLPGQNFSGAITFMNSRTAFVGSALPQLIAFEVTTADTVVPDETIVIDGKGWVNVREIFIQGRLDPLEVTWTNDTDWTATVDLQPGTNNLVFEAYDFQGNLIANAGDTAVTVGSTAIQPLLENLRISELMYHPADATPAEIIAGFTGASDFEYIELVNISTTDTLDLTGASFTDGVEFTFGATSLLPGQRILVVRDTGAFEARYGTGLSSSIAGEYGNGLEDLGIRKLSNGGETITLKSAANSTIVSFVYVDGDDPGEEDWHESTDGDGFSLVKINPADDVQTYNDGTAWRPSHEINGSPAAVDLILGDLDQDNRVGLHDLLILKKNFGTASSATLAMGDLNGDEAVNQVDLAILLQNYGRSYDPPVSAPIANNAHAAASAIVNIVIATTESQQPEVSSENITRSLPVSLTTDQAASNHQHQPSPAKIQRAKQRTTDPRMHHELHDMVHAQQQATSSPLTGRRTSHRTHRRHDRTRHDLIEDINMEK